MPTLRTVTVKSSGGDYTSLSAAEAGEQADLVTLDRQLDIACYAMEDTARVLFDGWTTDATRYIRVYTPASERHDGKWNASKYRLNITTAAFFTATDFLELHTRVEGLQISVTPDGNGRIAVGMTGGCRIGGCVIRSLAGSFSGQRGIVSDHSLGHAYVYNNVIYSDSRSTGDGVSLSTGNFTYKPFVYNNTIHNFNVGLQRDAGNGVVAKNNLVQSCTTCYGSTYDAASTNNVSEDATSPNASLRNRSATFVDEASFDFHLASGDTAARDAGADLSADAALSFTTDIDGQTRSGTWDVGADEYVAPAGGGSAVPRMMRYFRNRRVA